MISVNSVISELEFRFKDLYESDLFVSFLHDYFKDSFIDKESSKVSYEYKQNQRIVSDEEGNKKYIIKKPEKVKMYKHYKFTYSVEKEVEAFSLKDERRRNRIRSRYNLGENLELHITKIDGKYNEVELEYEIHDRLATDDDIEKFYSLAEKYIDIFEIHYSNIEKFIRNFNSGDSKAPYGKLDSMVVAKARDIEEKDFANKDGKGIMEGYTVTIKANGVPLLLYSSGTHLYFVNNNRETFKYLGKRAYEKFIIIGEYISEINSYAPFDILYTDRRKGIRFHPHHLERMEEAKDILEGLSLEDISFFWKPFIPVGKTVKQFEKSINMVKDQDYPFEDDGLIMTPLYAPHNSKIDRNRTSISEVPEILKIKPNCEQSFDVRVDLSKQKIYTHMSKQEYTGTKKYPLQHENILWESIPDNVHMKIIELSPVKNEDDMWVMKFNRERDDRINPNSTDLVNIVWNRINEPLNPDLFKAQGIPRLILQNRRVKTEILSKIPNKAIVVDLGTGRGGDISRYSRASHVLCVEPDEQNRNKLLERIRNKNLEHKFHVIPCGAQHTETIIKKLREIREICSDCPVVVSAMLSMTFFWQSQKFLDRFKETLRAVSLESGSADFYFFTVEGNKFLKYLQEKDGKINMKKFKAKYNPDPKYGVSLPGKVTIAIEETIVRPQTEFLVNLSDLDDTLEGMKVFNGKIEDFLTEHESIMAEASVYGYAKIR